MAGILLITPPFTQLNTPYPGTAYLLGFLKQKGIQGYQMDLGIEVTRVVFSREGLTDIFEYVESQESLHSELSYRLYARRWEYISTIDEVITFLQGKRPELVRKIASETYLPRGDRFIEMDYLDWTFGSMGLADKAKHLATLYLEDLTDFIKECVDEDFGVNRYAEHLGKSAHSFDTMNHRLSEEMGYFDAIAWGLLKGEVDALQPNLIGFSVPFPGNLYSAFRNAQQLKNTYPNIPLAMGGGFPNTELRSIQDPRVFDYFDFITLDDGERPLELIWDQVVCQNTKPEQFIFKRTFHLLDGALFYNNLSLDPDYSLKDLPAPDYTGLDLDSYISVIEIANPMHSLWSDGKWLKLTMAHGCYWGRCTFCDVSLDYIGRYEPVQAATLVDKMETLIQQTGQTGFHFVDEAAPPSLMKSLAIEILRRGLKVTWWTNIRFEGKFTFDLCRLLHSSGCVAVSGGLEVASDRLLKLIDKGVTVEQVAQTTHNFTQSGIMVHAYLMYGYPTQTIQETVDSLEIVRQMFEAEIIQSGFWHQFSLTAHSPIGLNPEQFQVKPNEQISSFARNDLEYEEENPVDHEQFGAGLAKSIYNYMYGVGLDEPLQNWFDFDVPMTTEKVDRIRDAVSNHGAYQIRQNHQVFWIGSEPVISEFELAGETLLQISFYSNEGDFSIEMNVDLGNWLLELIELAGSSQEKSLTLKQIKERYEDQFLNFELFWESDTMQTVREAGLLIV